MRPNMTTTVKSPRMPTSWPQRRALLSSSLILLRQNQTATETPLRRRHPHLLLECRSTACSADRQHAVPPDAGRESRPVRPAPKNFHIAAPLKDIVLGPPKTAFASSGGRARQHSRQGLQMQERAEQEWDLEQPSGHEIADKEDKASHSGVIVATPLDP
ncbi:hypothetical protein BC567DRAFT_238088 [Phyllosticta citribraziliensis]